MTAQPKDEEPRDLIAEALSWIGNDAANKYDFADSETGLALAVAALAEETRQGRLDTKKHRTEARAGSRRQHQELIRVLGRIR